VPSLAETRQVIATELQGHGHTADIDRPLSYEQMADAVAALLRHLEIEEADVFGFSMGLDLYKLEKHLLGNEAYEPYVSRW
jgi:pimeloyl-ACP methyl ester carboxylesterase